MARTDRAAFLAAMRDAEAGMDEVFGRLAAQVGRVVMAAAGPDGLIPEARIQDVQRQARALVDAQFAGAGGQPFDRQGEPLAPYPAVIAAGQRAAIDLALERTAATLDRYLSADVRAAWARRWGQR